MHNSKLQKFAI